MKEIFHRVSVRRFEDRPVEAEKVEQVLRAAMAAPSAGNQQPWDFYVVTAKEKLQALAQVSPYAGCAAHAAKRSGTRVCSSSARSAPRSACVRINASSHSSQSRVCAIPRVPW